MNSAYRALRDPRARLHLCSCLQKYVKRNQVILNNEQFEYVLKLLNESLLNDTRLDEHGVAYSILPLTSAFYRKLNNGTVDQCVYTRLQQHEVWLNMQFWEMSFYSDVQRSIRPVYLSNEEFAAEQEKENFTSHSDNSSSGSSSCNGSSNLEGITDSIGTNALEFQAKESKFKSPLAELLDEVDGKVSDISKPLRPDNLNIFDSDKQKIRKSVNKAVTLPEFGLNFYSRPAEKTALEICGEQMERVAHLTSDQRENYIRNEQGIIRSHVLHYITQMVNILIPLDINSRYITTEPTAKQQKSQKLVESPNSEPTTPHSQSFNEDTNYDPPSQSTTSVRKLGKAYN